MNISPDSCIVITPSHLRRHVCDFKMHNVSLKNSAKLATVPGLDDPAQSHFSCFLLPSPILHELEKKTMWNHCIALPCLGTSQAINTILLTRTIVRSTFLTCLLTVKSPPLFTLTTDSECGSWHPLVLTNGWKYLLPGLKPTRMTK